MKLFLISSICLIALGIGSNNASNALGVCIGAGVLSFKKAIILFGLLVFLGVFLNGQKVMDTVGKDLVEASDLGVAVTMMVSAGLILVSNWKRLPLSSHQVIIGGLLGSALAQHLKFSLKYLAFIGGSWFISPFIACGFGIALSKGFTKLTQRFPFFELENLLKALLLIGAALVSYNTGANELATVVGPLLHAETMISRVHVLALASFFVFLGTLLFSHRVIETVGKGIVPLDPATGFVAQFGAASTVYLFTNLGMPVSTTSALIGAISGVGLSKGTRAIKLSLVKRIVMNWIITFFLSMTIAYFITRLALR